jgi:YegS/Rv2252/BmrU family lipid kinase
MPRIKVILNPVADRGHARELVPQIKALLSANGDFGWVETSRPGEAVELAAQACQEGYDIVVAAGGDGTAQEVINGLLNGSRADESCSTLGLVPIGSGNDFAWMMGVAPGVRQTRSAQITEEAILKLLAGRTRTIDVGRICDEANRCRYFGNGVGIGFDGIVNIESRKIKWARGFLMYTLAVLRTMMFYYRAPHAILDLDSQRIEQPMMMISVGNGRRLAGGFYVTPQAEADDGQFDVCLVGPVSRPEMFMLIPRFLKGTQASHPQVKMMRAQRIVVRCDEGYAVHADGEIFATSAKTLTLQILPQKLRVIV